LQRFLTLSWSRSRDRLIEHRVDLRFVEAAGAPPEKGIATLLSGLGTGGGGNGGNSDALACWPSRPEAAILAMLKNKD
jgi:hypothetical protein